MAPAAESAAHANRFGANMPLYVPPTGDEPLDAIELALVRALVGIIVRDIREEAVADRA
jgi:hypothetical protein